MRSPAIRPAPGSTPIGRGPKVRTAVLAAVLAELVEAGYAGLTIDNVALRCGVHKTTIYRRWRDRETLVTDAVGDLAAHAVPLPDTGDIDADLQAFARSLVTFLAGPTGRALLAVLSSDAARLPEVAHARRQFLASRLAAAAPRIRAAIAAGHLHPGTDPDELVKALIAPIYLRLLMTTEPIDHHTADRAAQIALAAARAGVLHTPHASPPPTDPA